MAKQLTKNDKILWGLLGTSVLIMIFGILFLVNAMGIADFYPHFAAIKNALGKYIVVILTMSAGIMMFCNVALRFEDKKLRNGLTIGITVFAFILTIPLVYVFFSLLPFAANHNITEVNAAIEAATAANPDSLAKASEASATALGLNAVDKLMGVHTIYSGFCAWFGTSGFLWVVLVFMVILGIVFLLEPLVAGICVCKGKLLQLFGKKDGKFKVIAIVELPVLVKQREAQEAEEAARAALYEETSQEGAAQVIDND